MTIAVNRNLSNCENSPKKSFSGIQRDSNPWPLRWLHTHFICIPAVHIISFSVSFLSRVDELNKLASLQYMDLHSSAGTALQRLRRGHVSNRVEAPKNFFLGYFRNCLNCDSLRWSHTHFISIPTVHILSFRISILMSRFGACMCMNQSTFDLPPPPHLACTSVITCYS